MAILMVPKQWLDQFVAVCGNTLLDSKTRTVAELVRGFTELELRCLANHECKEHCVLGLFEHFFRKNPHYETQEVFNLIRDFLADGLENGFKNAIMVDDVTVFCADMWTTVYVVYILFKMLSLFYAYTHLKIKCKFMID